MVEWAWLSGIGYFRYWEMFLSGWINSSLPTAKQTTGWSLRTPRRNFCRRWAIVSIHHPSSSSVNPHRSTEMAPDRLIPSGLFYCAVIMLSDSGWAGTLSVDSGWRVTPQAGNQPRELRVAAGSQLMLECGLDPSDSANRTDPPQLAWIKVRITAKMKHTTGCNFND